MNDFMADWEGSDTSQSGRPSRGDKTMPDMGNFDGMMNNGQGTGTNTTSIRLLAVSILLLAVGPIVAVKFKR